MSHRYRSRWALSLNNTDQAKSAVESMAAEGRPQTRRQREIALRPTRRTAHVSPRRPTRPCSSARRGAKRRRGELDQLVRCNLIRLEGNDAELNPDSIFVKTSTV